MKYKVWVIADSSGKWCANGLEFDSIEKAKEYGADLAWRWTAVRNWRAEPVGVDPNA
jgi:hypothetical protein